MLVGVINVDVFARVVSLVLSGIVRSRVVRLVLASLHGAPAGETGQLGGGRYSEEDTCYLKSTKTNTN